MIGVNFFLYRLICKIKWSLSRPPRFHDKNKRTPLSARWLAYSLPLERTRLNPPKINKSTQRLVHPLANQDYR